MTVALEMWQLISLAIALMGAFAGLVKLLLMQFERGVAASLAQIKEDSSKWHALELRFYQHLADLPISYVRREDYVRGQTVIEAKLDAIASELKTVQVKRSGQ